MFNWTPWHAVRANVLGNCLNLVELPALAATRALYYSEFWRDWESSIEMKLRSARLWWSNLTRMFEFRGGRFIVSDGVSFTFRVSLECSLNFIVCFKRSWWCFVVRAFFGSEWKSWVTADRSELSNLRPTLDDFDTLYELSSLAIAIL